MPGTIFGLPFDEEIFMQMWSAVPDPTRNAIIESGAMVQDGNIGSKIQNDGNFYTIPFYNTLGGEALNYDGKTNNVPTETDGTFQSGVVWGRMKSWIARDFAAELSGGDPMGHITASTGRYWQKVRQATLINILSGIFGITGTEGHAKKWKENNTANLSSTSATPYLIGEADANDLMTMAAGDNKQGYSMALMHSHVANTLEKKQLLEYWKSTDANGIQRRLNLASYNGLTVIIDDGVPAKAKGGSGADQNLIDYTTYLFGNGVLRQSNARLDNPVEGKRDPEKYGGVDVLYTKIRETIHPNGFSFILPSGVYSPEDAQLADPNNWKIVFDPKSIAMARLITNG